MKLDRMGWIVAAGLAGAMFGMGMQSQTPKFANVDMAKVFDESDLTKSSNGDLQAYQKDRVDVLQFLQQNLAMKPDDAQKFADLSLKSPRTAAEDAELKRIRADADQASTLQRGLMTKQNATAQDNATMAQYRTNEEANNELGKVLEQRYEADIQNKRQQLHDQAMEKVRDAVADVARKQQYTIVFGADAAPFASNDLTADALKVVKK